MNFLKKHKATVIVIVIFIVLVIVGYNVYNLLVPNTGKPIYGNRLDGKDAVAVTTDSYNQVKTGLEQETFVSSVTTDERGKLINVIVTVENDTTLDTAKTLGDKVLTYFTDAQKAYFDFQILVKKADTTQLSFPIIGYKHHMSEGFTWTKDRVNE